MDVTCEKCHTEYEFDDALVSEQGTSVRCTQCGHRFKVRRSDGASTAPELWMVRTVDGLALEFRALRELKNAIASGKISRDDVLSRGAGRPRRLASIAELEPFFAAQPAKMVSTAPGLGQSGSRASEGAGARIRQQTPAGIGPAEARRTSPEFPPPEPVTASRDHSVAIPLPRETRSSIPVVVPPPVSTRPAPETRAWGDDEDEPTEVTRRRATKELGTLGEEPPPASAEPPTIPEPPRSGEAPPTVAGVAPPAPAAQPAADPPRPPDSITKTMAYGTPRSIPKGAAPPPEPGPSSEPPTGKRQAPRPPVPVDAFPASSRSPATAHQTDDASAALADTSPASQRAEAASSRAALPPPPAEVPEAPPAAPPAPTPTPPPADVADDAAGAGAAPDARASVLTPTPPDARYSLYEDADREIAPSGYRSSAAHSRRSAGSMRLIVGLLVGGAIAFVAVLAIQRYLPKTPTAATSASSERVLALLEAGDKSLRDGDLESAKEQFDKASALAESDPRVAKALARLAVVRAEVPWLELLILPSGDPGLDAVKRRYREAVDRAQKAAEHASQLAGSDPEVVRLQVDVKRISGDVAGARKLTSSLDRQQADTQLTLGALDLTGESPPFSTIVEQLGKAAEDEGGVGRARSLLVYALARSGDVKAARAELERLSKLARAHPLEAELRRFIERVEKGETAVLKVDELPSIAPSGTSEPGGASTLDMAREALRNKQYEAAERLFQSVVDADNSSPEGLAGLAAVALAQGKTKRAAGIYQRIVDKHPNNLQAVVQLADMKWDGGERGDAATLYRRALDLGATGQTAERARARSQVGSSSGGGAAPPVSASTSSGGEPVPTSTAPDSATSGGASDVPPFEWDGAPPGGSP